MKADRLKMYTLITALIGLIVILISCSKSESSDDKTAKAEAKPQSASAVPPLLVPAAQQNNQQTAKDMESISTDPAAAPFSVSEEQRLVQLVAARNQKLYELEKSNSLAGMSQVELETLLGKPTHVQDEGKTLIYRLDSGFGGFEWTFEIQNNKVSKATKQHLN
jgi:hypothetical protein